MVRKGTKSEGMFEYLNNFHKLMKAKCSAQNPKDFKNLDLLKQALEVRISSMISHITQK
jgi:hypothetical protein